MKSKIILGTMSIDENKYEQSIKSAKEVGYELIDTAWIYKNEKFIGQVDKSLFNDLKLQTKIWPDFYSDVKTTLNNQFKDLGIEKIYSVLLHRPSINFYETIDAWKQLINLQKQGLIEKIGVSNFDKDMLEILVKETGVKPYCNQIELSILNFREDRVFYCKENDIEIQAWSPMGKDSLVLENKVAIELANKYNVSVNDIAISFLTSQNINVVVKSQSHKHIKQNYDAQNLVLSEDDINNLKKENRYLNKFEESYPY